MIMRYHFVPPRVFKKLGKKEEYLSELELLGEITEAAFFCWELSHKASAHWVAG